MIFVVTGVHEHGFDRLVIEVDRLSKIGTISDVFIQTGYSNYAPQYCEWSKTIDFYDFEKLMNNAELIITHGGAGCIAGALERNKKTIVVPRRQKYNEHNNDHQLELSADLEKNQRVLVCYEMEKLSEILAKVDKFVPKPTLGNNNIINIINNYLEELSTSKSKRYE